MSLIVQKFGGSSVKDKDCLFRIAKTITDTYIADNEVVVVVSAQGDTTDELIKKAREINPCASKRELDMLLSTGEQISVSLLAMAIEGMGYPVISLTGWQAGFLTSSDHGSARICRIDSARIRRELDQKKIVIVAGFQGIDGYDDITTLGRGGSDTSAVALAAVLHADHCQIYTDVDGVFTADPRIVPNAAKLDEITYDEMLEFASLGAGVLHNRSVEIAKNHQVNLEVLSSLNHHSGTAVKQKTEFEKQVITGVARDLDIARISLIGLPNSVDIECQIFTSLAEKKINVDLISQSIGRHRSKAVSFTVSLADKAAAIAILQREAKMLNGETVEADDNVAKISVVGSGMLSHPGVAARMFKALSNADIKIQMIATSEIKISVLVSKEDADAAVIAIHDEFDL